VNHPHYSTTENVTQLRDVPVAFSEEPETPRQFFMLTPAIMARLASLKDASASMVFLVIAQHANHDTHRWDLSVKQIARESGISETTVKKAMRKLEDAKYIAIEATYCVDGEYLTVAQIVARPGWRLVRSPNPSGADRWEVVRPNHKRSEIERIPVGQGFNRYTLLLRPFDSAEGVGRNPTPKLDQRT
jgi:hypothetical protein